MQCCGSLSSQMMVAELRLDRAHGSPADKGRQRAFYWALNACLEWLLMFKALCATSGRNMCLSMVSGVVLKPHKICFSKGLKSELCRLEKIFKIIKPNCSRKTKQPFFWHKPGLKCLYEDVIYPSYSSHVTRLQSYGSFPSVPLSKSKLLLYIVGVWFWLKTCPF